MFIIDFDDTLFDTQAFKQARLDAVQRLGVSENEYWETYRIARNSADGAVTYTNERHAQVLSSRGYNENEVLQMLEETTGASVVNFLFDDTVAFLEKIKKIGEPMILLSLGNPGFQELKTKGSKIDKYFDRTIFVHDTKMNVLEELLSKIKDKDCWFINDKVKETTRLSKAYPELKPILKVSKQFEKSDYKASGLPYFQSLTQINEYVEKARK